MNLFTVIYEDNSVFKGGDLLNPNWLAIAKPIHTLIYFLPSGDNLLFSNFKRIYHCVDGTKDIMGENKGKLQIEYTHIFIERNEKITYYKIDLRQKNIEVKDLELNNELVLSLNKIGWKNGTNK